MAGGVNSLVGREGGAGGNFGEESSIEGSPAREALKFMFSPQGTVFRCACRLLCVPKCALPQLGGNLVNVTSALQLPICDSAYIAAGAYSGCDGHRWGGRHIALCCSTAFGLVLH